jgi:hypothetical protein
MMLAPLTFAAASLAFTSDQALAAGQTDIGCVSSADCSLLGDCSTDRRCVPFHYGLSVCLRI